MRLVLLLVAALPLAAQCTYTVTPAPLPAPPYSVPAGGGDYTINVKAPDGCAWSYSLQQSFTWITVTSGPPNGSGNGNGIIAWTAAANPYPLQTRSAKFQIQPITTSAYVINIFQSAPSCSVTLSPSTPATVPVVGGSGSLSVRTNCAWSAGVSANWIQLSDTSTSGTGSGTLDFTVQPNSCVSGRSGAITVVQTAPNPVFTINQDGSPANLTIAPASATIPAAATTGPVAVQVKTGDGCGWSSSKDVSWLRVASGASGSGSATMLILADANPGTQARTGRVTMSNGSVFTLTQQGVPTPVPQLSSIKSAASFAVAADAAGSAAGAVSPGEIVSLFGSDMGPAQGVTLQLSPDGRSVSKSLGGVQVLFDGTPAALTYVGAGQINAVVPYGVSGSTKVQVQYDQAASNTLTVPVQAAVPAVFTADSSGRGAGAILNQDGVTLNTYAHPAPKGSVVSIYCTGGGATQPASVDGAMTAAEPLPWLVEPVTVTIGGVASPRLWYAGGAPGSIAGLTQVNAQVPDGIPSGQNALVVQIGGQQSQAGVVVYVQ